MGSKKHVAFMVWVRATHHSMMHPHRRVRKKTTMTMITTELQVCEPTGVQDRARALWVKPTSWQLPAGGWEVGEFLLQTARRHRRPRSHQSVSISAKGVTIPCRPFVSKRICVLAMQEIRDDPSESTCLHEMPGLPAKLNVIGQRLQM